MTINSIDKITQAIKSFDIASLKELLDDDTPYQDVTKSAFSSKTRKEV